MNLGEIVFVDRKESVTIRVIIEECDEKPINSWKRLPINCLAPSNMDLIGPVILRTDNRSFQ